ncbi:MAG: hypothetical protein AAFV85_24165 [Cyanobacteria bacterium J06634_6]
MNIEGPHWWVAERKDEQALIYSARQTGAAAVGNISTENNHS